MNVRTNKQQIYESVYKMYTDYKKLVLLINCKYCKKYIHCQKSSFNWNIMICFIIISTLVSATSSDQLFLQFDH